MRRSATIPVPDSADAIVVGAGFGGLGAALALAERGCKVVVLEALRYPGGCASTFVRHGDIFESGATLFSGFGEGQLFAQLIARHGLPVRTVALDPIVELRGPDLTLAIPSTRAELVRRLSALRDAPRPALERFFARQAAVADALWPLFDDASLLPPFDLKSLFRHAKRLGQYLAVAPILGKPLLRVLEQEGVADFAPLRIFVDAVCQITVQASAKDAEAPLALAALDYFFRGARHVEGGIGELAWALSDAIERLGGEVSYANRATAITTNDGVHTVRCRRGVVRAPIVIADVLPQVLGRLHPAPSPRLDERGRRVEQGWGAVMRYLVVDGAQLARAGAHHLELVADATKPYIEGNHLFCSISSAEEQRTQDGLRTVTISTHVPLAPDAIAGRDEARYIAGVQAEIDRTLLLRAPELVHATRRQMTGSPRTFERFTGRTRGLVGGIPRTAGLHNYRGMSPRAIWPGVFLVGDSVFPGQSTLSAMLGGSRTADIAMRGANRNDRRA